MDQRTFWGVVPSTLKLFLISPAAVLGVWKCRRHPEEPDPRVVQRSAAPSHQLQQRHIERKRFGHWLIIFGTEIYYKNKLYIYIHYTQETTLGVQMQIPKRLISGLDIYVFQTVPRPDLCLSNRRHCARAGWAYVFKQKNALGFGDVVWWLQTPVASGNNA